MYLRTYIEHLKCNSWCEVAFVKVEDDLVQRRALHFVKCHGKAQVDCMPCWFAADDARCSWKLPTREFDWIRLLVNLEDGHHCGAAFN